MAGGAERDRTDDLKLAKLALSQLSYSPFQMSDGLPSRRAPVPSPDFAKGGYAGQPSLAQRAKVGGPGWS